MTAASAETMTAAAPEGLLAAESVAIAFGGNQALDGVSVAQRRGEILGLIGPNGSGKSTLLNVVGGLYAPNAGRILFEGREVQGWAPHRIAAAGMARTFQNPRVFLHMTALENMLVGGFAVGAQGGSHAALLARARDLLAFLEISRLADERAGNLSGGQRMLLQFARALMLGPKLMLLDEPFGGVHPRLIQRMLDRIRELHAGGIDFVVVSHELPTLMGLVDRLVVLANGVKIADGPPGVVAKDDAVIEAYLGV